jgi:hypothetical protein
LSFAATTAPNAPISDRGACTGAAIIVDFSEALCSPGHIKQKQPDFHLAETKILDSHMAHCVEKLDVYDEFFSATGLEWSFAAP